MWSKKELPNTFRFPVFDSASESGNGDSSRRAVDDSVSGVICRDAHEKQEILVPQFRQRLNVRPEGFDLVQALQIELVNDDIAMPTPSVRSKSI